MRDVIGHGPCLPMCPMGKLRTRLRTYVMLHFLTVHTQCYPSTQSTQCYRFGPPIDTNLDPSIDPGLVPHLNTTVESHMCSTIAFITTTNHASYFESNLEPPLQQRIRSHSMVSNGGSFGTTSMVGPYIVCAGHYLNTHADCTCRCRCKTMFDIRTSTEPKLHTIRHTLTRSKLNPCISISSAICRWPDHLKFHLSLQCQGRCREKWNTGWRTTPAMWHSPWGMVSAHTWVGGLLHCVGHSVRNLPRVPSIKTAILFWST